MLKQKTKRLSKQMDSFSQRNQQDSDFSCESEQIGEQLCDLDPKNIEQILGTMDKLKTFVQQIPEEQVAISPTCVERHCQKIEKYHLKIKKEVLDIAEKRISKMLRNKKIKKNWNSYDISLLVWLTSKIICKENLGSFEAMQKEHWKNIASLISGTTWQKCKYKWLSLKKVKLISKQWSKEEEKHLSQAIKQIQKFDWKFIAEKLYEKNEEQDKVFRTPKQCREHWNCFLNPSIQKGPWSIGEDRKLLEFVQDLQGCKKWSQISKFMKGRTQNALKNRYNLLIMRQKKITGQVSQKRLLKLCLTRLLHQQKINEKDSKTSSRIMRQNVAEQHLLEEQQKEEQNIHQHPIIPSFVQNSQYIPQTNYNLPQHFLLNNSSQNTSTPVNASYPVLIGFMFGNGYNLTM